MPNKETGEILARSKNRTQIRMLRGIIYECIFMIDRYKDGDFISELEWENLAEDLTKVLKKTDDE